MGTIYYQSNRHNNQIVDFEHMNEDYRWAGDYDLDEEGEENTSDCPGWSEQTVKIVFTDSLAKWDDQLDQWVEIKPTASLLLALELEIESQL